MSKRRKSLDTLKHMNLQLSTDLNMSTMVSTGLRKVRKFIQGESSPLLFEKFGSVQDFDAVSVRVP